MSRRPCRQCGHKPEEETGADHFEEETDVIRTVDVEISNDYNHIVTPQWVDAIFNNLERGYIDNGKYHCRAIHFVEPESESIWSPETLRDATSRDVELNPIYNLLSSYTECPERDRLAHLDDITKTYCADWKQLKLEQGLIYRRWHDKTKDAMIWQLIPPTVYRQSIFNVAHNSMSGGHLGFQKMRDWIQSKFYWSSWSSDIQFMCVKCIDCAQFFRGNTPHTVALQSMTVGYPWEIIGIDVTGPHPRSLEGKRIYHHGNRSLH